MSTSVSPQEWGVYGGNDDHADVDVAQVPGAGVLYEEWTTPALDGAIDAEPVVDRGCLVVATEADSLYAFDAFSGALRWHDKLGTAVPGRQLPCSDIVPSGITSTPVVGTGGSTVWVSAFAGTDAGPEHQLVEVRVSDGKILRRRDIDPPGLEPRLEQQRGALILSSGYVLVPFGGFYGQCGNYRGALEAVPEAGGRILTWNPPALRGGGIWAPGGVDVLASGELVLSVGNRRSRPGAIAGPGWVAELSPELWPLALFAPPGTAGGEEGSDDLGSTAPAILPGREIFQVGTDGTGYLLGVRGAGHGLRLVSSLRVCPTGGAFANDAVYGGTVYVACQAGLTAVAVTSRVAKLAWRATGVVPGAPEWAGGKVWVETATGMLEDIDPTTGHVVQQLQLSLPSSDFPWLIADGETMYAPDGRRIMDLTGL